jgi:hypothetical protein
MKISEPPYTIRITSKVLKFCVLKVKTIMTV